MASDSFIRLPDDASNPGKKVRVQQRVVGADTVYEHYVILGHQHDITGVYYGHSGRLGIQAAAHASDEGFLYLFNPIGSGMHVDLQRVKFQASPTAAAAMNSSPRVTMERFTFTGTHGGAVITTARRNTVDAASVGRLATNKTGLTVTPGGVIRAFLTPCVMTGVGPGIPLDMVWDPKSHYEETTLNPGEGFIFRQADAGSAGDSRVAIIDLAWMEHADY